MKIKIRPDEASVPGGSEWAAMNDWLAELREDDQAEPDHEGRGEPARDGYTEPARDGYTEPASEGYGTSRESCTRPDSEGRTGPVRDNYTKRDSERRVQPASEGEPRATAPAAAPVNWYAPRIGAQARARMSAPAGASFVRAVIGDELRTPTAWCEMSSCISCHADRSALGEADIRARAIGAGWRIDALGRLVCPQCQQTSASFRATRPVVPWDRATAITMAARATAWGNRRPAHGQR